MSDPKKAAQFSQLKDAVGNWIVRDDVFVRFKTRHETKKGGLSIGFAGYPGKHHIGPEFQFGHVAGSAFEEPVLLIKTAWGGKSLFKDFRPPSAGGETGPYYKQMIQEVREALNNVSTEFPSLADRKLNISGFVWMQVGTICSTRKLGPSTNRTSFILSTTSELNSNNRCCRL